MNQVSDQGQSRAARPAAPSVFSWGRLIYDMQLRGLPAMLACHCQPLSYDAAVPHLVLEMHEQMRGISASPAMERLRAGLLEFFGEGLKLEIVYGPAPQAPAIRAQEAKVDKFAKVYSAFANDDFVNEMIEEFGASILIESVQPAPPPKTPAGAEQVPKAPRPA
jgi:DNA polymerase-3 subunit gamma/tau